MAVRHDNEGSRFVLETRGGEAVLSYAQRENGDLDLLHTEVPMEAQGEGVGGDLVLAALEHARAQEVKVVPSCPFVRSYIEKNPDQSDAVRM